MSFPKRCALPEEKRNERRELRNKAEVSSSDKNEDQQIFLILRILLTLPPKHSKPIIDLIYLQDQFDIPSKPYLDNLPLYPSGKGEAEVLQRFEHVTVLTALTVMLVVDFAMMLDGFDDLKTEDQHTLLKASSSEVMMLRAARHYDIATDSIVYASGRHHSRDDHREIRYRQYGR